MPPKKKNSWGGNGSGKKGGGNKVDASVLGLAPTAPMLGGVGGLVGGGVPVVPGMDPAVMQQLALMSQLGGNNLLSVEMSTAQALQVQAAMAQLQAQQKTTEEEEKQKAIQEGVRLALKKKGITPTMANEERAEDEVSEISARPTKNERRRQRLQSAEAKIGDLEMENAIMKHTLDLLKGHAKGGAQSDDEGIGAINSRALRKVIRKAEVEGRSLSLNGKTQSTNPTPKTTPTKTKRTQYRSIISDDEASDDAPPSGGGLMAKVKARAKKTRKVDESALKDPTYRAHALTETLDEVLGKIKANGGTLQLPDKEDEGVVKPMATKVANIYHNTSGKESVTELIDGMLLGKYGFVKGALSLTRYLCHVLWHILANGVDLEAHQVFMKIVYKK